MTIDLPVPISTYFNAKNALDIEATLAAFADTAKVHDEKHDYVGRPAIRDWIDSTTRKYRFTATPTAIDRQGDATIVTALVAGNFPGSPVELRYRFEISGDRIVGLEIG